MNLIPSVITGIAAVSCVLGQTQRIDRSIFFMSDWRVMGTRGSTDWSFTSQGNVHYVKMETVDCAKAFTAVDSPGAIHVIADQDAIVGGRLASGSGVVQHWKYDGHNLVLQSSLEVPGADIVGLVYARDCAKLYLLDAVGKQVLRGSWDPLLPLSGVALSQLVGVSGIPDLNNAASRMLVRQGTAMPLTLQLVYWPLVSDEVGVTIVDGATGVGSGNFVWSEGFPRKDVYADETTATEGGVTIKVWAPQGVAFEVVDLDTASVVGSGVAGPGGNATVALSQPLVLGRRYMARRVGQVTEFDEGFSCVRRYGVPEVFSDGTVVDSMYFQRGARIGEQFVVEVGLNKAGAPFSTDAVIPGVMLIGFRAGGVDPIVPYGSNWLLLSGVYLPAKCVVTAESGWGLAFSTVTIPNDPGLVGLTYLVQFVMEDGPDYRLSEVYGALIEGAGGSGLAQGASAGPTATGSELGAQHLLDAKLMGRLLDATPLLLQALSRR